MLIDFHTDIYREPGYADQLAEAARNLGFDRVCIGGGRPAYGLADNDQVLQDAQTYPELFVPFAFLDLVEARASNVEVLEGRGFQGLRLAAPPAPYDDERFFPIYEAAQALNMPVLFHSGLLPSTPLDRALDVRCERMRPVYLDTVARFFPQLNIVGVGLGTPWHEEACETLRHHTNLFFDLSGPTLRRKGPDSFRGLFGAEKASVLEKAPSHDIWDQIVFGSAARHEHIASVEEEYERLFRSLALSEEVRDAVMGNTAQRLLGLSE